MCGHTDWAAHPLKLNCEKFLFDILGDPGFQCGYGWYSAVHPSMFNTKYKHLRPSCSTLRDVHATFCSPETKRKPEINKNSGNRVKI